MAAPQLSRAPFRLQIALIVVVGIGLLLAARLFYWQIIEWDRMKVAATDEATIDATIPARRGDILTADGLVVAAEVQSAIVSATPKYMSKPEDVAREIAPILGQTYESVLSKLNTKADSVVLARGASMEAANKIRDLQAVYVVKKPDPGMSNLQLEIQTSRRYPLRNFAAPVIGYVNAAGTAAYGVEQYKDRELRGTPGKMHGAVDALKDIIPDDLPAREPPIDGFNVILTINSAMQQIAETELSNAIKATRAASGSIIVLDPRTGAILAMAVNPTSDLNEYWKPGNEGRYVNPTIMSEYEPGSVFKVFTVGAALDAGTLSTGTTFDDNGSLLFGGVTIYNHDMLAPGRVNMVQVLERSLNVEAAKISVGLGVQRFYEYVRRFGFGAITRVELGSEMMGVIKTPGDGRWRDSDLATNAFGQGISSTPLQMAAAVAAVANEGRLMRPYVVQEIQEPNGRVTKTQPQVVRQVLRPETARTLTQLLAEAIIAESTNKAIVSGYRIAGKTGTAQIPIYGGYDPKWTIASFCGYLPADDPKFVILVKLDKPQTSEWGSQVASPVFASVAKQLVMLTGLPPDSIRLASR